MVHDGSSYSENPRDPVLFHHPTTRPGARLAHARLQRGGSALSTLDLVDGLSFTLLTGRDGAAWRDAAERVSRELGIGIAAHAIGAGNLHDPHDDWARVREIDDSGCVLVRPDRHIGWRSMSSHDDSHGGLLRVIGS